MEVLVVEFVRSEVVVVNIGVLVESEVRRGNDW